MNRTFRNIFFWGVILLVIFSVITLLTDNGTETKEYELQEFMEALEGNEIKEMTMQPKDKIYRITGELEKDSKNFVAQVPDNPTLIEKIRTKAQDKSIIKVEPEEQPSVFANFLTMMLPFLLIGLIFFFFLTRAQGGGGGAGRAMNFGKSKAKLYNEEQKKVRFKDVAGADEEKQELVEVV